MRAPGSKSFVSPFLFLQAFGAVEKEDGQVVFNGENSMDAWDFLMRLLEHLQLEEEAEIGRDPAKKTTVQEYLEGESSAKASGFTYLAQSAYG